MNNEETEFLQDYIQDTNFKVKKITSSSACLQMQVCLTLNRI